MCISQNYAVLSMMDLSLSRLLVINDFC